MRSKAVESLMATALGLASDASAQDVDEAIRETRFHAYLNGKLGLPIDASGDALLSTVDERLNARAAAVGLPGGSKLPEIVAAEAAKPQQPPAAPASDGNESVQRTLAEIRDRLAHVPTTEEQKAAEEDAAADALARGRYTATNGRVVGEDSSADQSSAWR